MRVPLPNRFLCVFVLCVACVAPATADVRMPSIFGSHMVLQRDQEVAVWGWADAKENIVLSLNGSDTQEQVSTAAGEDGRWRATLPAHAAGGPYTLTVQGGNTVTFENVMFGEVWICSGQSNMAWPVSNSTDQDLHALAANYPNIRLISVPQVGTQEPQDNFNGQWQACTPETVRSFSAVGYYFGRQLHQTLNVPIGLIDNAWGGSACEAWVRRDLLQKDERYGPLLERWRETESTWDQEQRMAAFQKRLEQWQAKARDARAAGKPQPGGRPRAPRNPLAGQHRPANLYNGVLKPTIGYGIRGAIWYQGESNAGRAYQYRHLFPLMIDSWRQEWGQGDFPFYWVQLADFRAEVDGPQDSDWAELREAQTMTMSKLPNTGEAVIIDIGEGRDIHPRNKLDVARRLARWALARDYGVKIDYRSPLYTGMEKQGNKIVITFDHVGPGLYTFDVREPVGFTIAGGDKKFVTAKARLVPNQNNQIEVWSDEVSDPVAVRYAWADNPICNVYSRNGLPATPFRTDDWPGVTADVHK